MLRKAKSPIALIMALILCISLFSGIVLAEGNDLADVDYYAQIKGDSTDGVYAPAANTVFVDPSYADENLSEDATIVYTYGGKSKGWGDGATYSLVVGTSFFTNIADVKTLLSAADCSGIRTVVLAPGSYASLYPAYDVISTTSEVSITVLGPQAGKTPINNPKKGYTGDAPWSVANGRSTSTETEAVFNGNINLRNENTRYIYDGIVFNGLQLYSQANENYDYWFTAELNNIYWVPPAASAMFSWGNTRTVSGTSKYNTMHRVLFMTDCYIDVTSASISKFYNSSIAAQKIIIDGCFWNIGEHVQENVVDKNLIDYYGSHYAVTADGKSRAGGFYGDGKDGVEIRNSKILNNPLRGIQNDLTTATQMNYAARLTRSVVHRYDNNDFINACAVTMKTDGSVPGVAAIRIKTQNKQGAENVVFTNNWVEFTGAKKTGQAFIDIHRNNTSYKVDVTADIRDNTFINTHYIAGYAGSYSPSNTWNITYNYVGDLNGNVATMNRRNSGTINGQYLDRECTYHSLGLKLYSLGNSKVTTASNPTFAGSDNKFTTSATVAVSANAPAVAAFEDHTISAKLYSDADCTTELTSLATVPETIYVKGTKVLNDKTFTIICTVTTSDGDPYSILRDGEVSEGVYKTAADVHFVDSTFAGKTAEDGPFEYTYGDGINWGDGKTYSLTYGTSAFATGEEIVALYPGEGYSTKKAKIVFAPGSYKLELGCWAFSNTTANILGPQAGKTPINNPKKGYTGDAPWSVANGRSGDGQYEAILNLGKNGGTELPQNGTIIYDGFAFDNYCLSRSDTSGNTSWADFVFKNCYWDLSDGGMFFNVNPNAANKFHRNFYFIDTIFDYSRATKMPTQYARVDDFVMDGIYFVSNPEIVHEAYDGDTRVPANDYNYSMFRINATLEGYSKNNVSEFKVINSCFEDVNFRSLFYTYQDDYCAASHANYIAPKDGHLAYIFDNNDFVNIGAKVNAGFPTVARIRTNRDKSVALTFTNNTLVAEGAAKKGPAVDIYKADDWTNNLGLYSSVVKNNISTGYPELVDYAYSNAYIPGTEIDISRNYFEDMNDNMLVPTGNGIILTGAYVDKGLSVHTDDLEVELKSDSDLIDGAVSAYNAYTISGKMAADGTLTADSFTTKAGATATLLDANGNEIESLAGSETAVQNCKLKVAKTGTDGEEYGVTYTVTVYPPYDNYEGDKLFYDPAVASLEDGALALYELDGEKLLFTVGENVFGAINTTNFPADENGTGHVYFFAKEYTVLGTYNSANGHNHYEIASGSYYFHGAKAGINPNVTNDLKTANPERATDEGETIINAPEVSIETTGKLTFDGFTFTGSSAIVFISGSEDTVRTVDFINNRTSIETKHTVATTGFFRATAQTQQNVNIRNNRLSGISMTSNPQAIIMLRNWHGTVEGNYLSAEGSNSSRVFWMQGEKSNESGKATTYDVTIQNNYMVGRASSNIAPYFAADYKVHFLNNTIVALEKNTSMFTIKAYGTLKGGSPTNFSTSDIQIVGNTILNPNNVEGVGFIWFAYEASTDAQKADAKEYNDNIKIQNNKVDLGTKADYIFGVSDTITEDKVVIDVTNNEILNVASLRGSKPMMFEDDQSVLHFDLGTGKNATTVGGVAVDTKPAGSAITNAPASGIIAVDKTGAYTFTSSPNTTVVVLDKENNLLSYGGTYTPAEGVSEVKVVLAAMDGSYNVEEARTIKFVTKLATVSVNETSAERFATAEDITDNDAWKQNYDAEKPWTTYWEAKVSVSGAEGISEIVAGSDIQIKDYGMYYSNDEAELNKLIAGEAYNEKKAQVKSYVSDDIKDALTGYANKVYREYSFEIYGIKDNKYRYGVFYLTYSVDGGNTWVTTTSECAELFTEYTAPQA